MAQLVRQQFAAMDKTGLEVQRNPYSQTGFTNVIEVKGKFQARLHAKSSGIRKRRQYSIPGLFETAQEAAEYLAMIKRDGLDGLIDEEGIPFKQDKEHRRRKKQSADIPADTQQEMQAATQPMPTVIASPLYFAMPHLPVACASPLPMQLLSYTPPNAP